jgi:hypothetical protein
MRRADECVRELNSPSWGCREKIEWHAVKGDGGELHARQETFKDGVYM